MPPTTHQAVAWPSDQVAAVVWDTTRLATCLPGAVVRRAGRDGEAPSIRARLGPGDVEVDLGLTVRGDGRHSIVGITATPTHSDDADSNALHTGVTRLAQQLAANLEGLLATAPQPVRPLTRPSDHPDLSVSAAAPPGPARALRRLSVVVAGVVATWVAVRLRRGRHRT